MHFLGLRLQFCMESRLISRRYVPTQLDLEKQRSMLHWANAALLST